MSKIIDECQCVHFIVILNIMPNCAHATLLVICIYSYVVRKFNTGMRMHCN